MVACVWVWRALQRQNGQLQLQWVLYCHVRVFPQPHPPTPHLFCLPGLLWVCESLNILFNFIYQRCSVHLQSRTLARTVGIRKKPKSTLIISFCMTICHMLHRLQLSYASLPRVPLCPSMSDWLRVPIYILVSLSNHRLTGQVVP